MQLLFNTLITAGCIILAAVSFRFVYTTARFFHFAHAATITVGAYAVWFLVERQVALPLASLLAVFVSCFFGVGVFYVFLRPLIKRQATPLTLLLGSLSLQLIIQYSIALVFGNDARSLLISSQVSVYAVGGGYVTATHLWLIGFAAVTPLLVNALYSFTMFGKRQQAVAEHRELSAVFGIDPLKVDLGVFAVASAIGGALGVLVAADIAISPEMGMSWLLPGVVAVIVGGVVRLDRILYASLALAVLKTATIWFPGSAWQDILLYSMLLLYFIVKPTGLASAAARS